MQRDGEASRDGGGRNESRPLGGVAAVMTPLLIADLKECKDIPVGIGDLEAPQPSVDERQLLHEQHTALAELVEERSGSSV